MRFRARVPSICLILLSVGQASSAFEISGGLDGYQVIQRGADGTGSITLGGRTGSAGILKLRLSSADGPVSGFSDRSVATLAAGDWSARLEGLPAGGPYRVELFQEDAMGRQVGREIFEQVLVGDLWVLAGQSNMVGRAALENVEQPDPRVNALRPDDVWAKAEEPLHERRERYGLIIGAGLGLSFAKEMVRRTGVPIGLIPCAKGGTSLWEWDPALKSEGRASLYGNMLARVGLAGGWVAGVLWYQGEADARPERAPEYLERFQTFVASVREDLSQTELPFYFAQLSRNVTAETESRNGRTWSAVQEAQRRAAKKITKTGMVAGVDLTLMDLIHLDTASLKRLGVRLAKRVCQDLFSAKCSSLQPGPQLNGAEWEAPFRLRVRFAGVNGRLQAKGRLLGFGISGQDGGPLPVIYRASVAADTGSAVILELNRRYEYPQSLVLWYGYGMDPPSNVTDAEDLAAPAFGPIALPPRPTP